MISKKYATALEPRKYRGGDILLSLFTNANVVHDAGGDSLASPFVPGRQVALRAA